jgi:tetratricopeptide (TPR) repeat protein
MMKFVSTFASAVALVAAGAAAGPAFAAKPAAAPAAAAAAPQRSYKFSKEERAALQPIETAVKARDWAKATSLAAAAQPAMQGTDAKYALGQFELQIGIGANDKAMQAKAINDLIASGGVPAAELPNLYRNQAAFALQANNNAAAEAAFQRVIQLAPNDPEAYVNLARIRNDTRRPQEALQAMDKAIELKRAAGQPVDVSWYRYALKIAYDNRMKADSLRISRALVAAYPTKENWRDTLIIFREVNTLDRNTTVDLLRLMRASKALTSERDWYDLAEALGNAGLPGEEQAVLQEGASLHVVDLNKAGFREMMQSASSRVAADRASLPGIEAKALAAPTGTIALNTGDAYYGYGNYAKAATLYRAALGKSGVDPNVVNFHLGMALAMSGDKAGAQAAFRAVTGPRAEVAGLWMAWLGQAA